MKKSIPKKQVLVEGMKFAEQCDDCKEGMDEGFVISSIATTETYCSEACLHKHHTKAEYNAMVDADEDDEDLPEGYWTEWEMPFDAKYIVKNGKLKEIKSCKN